MRPPPLPAAGTHPERGALRPLRVPQECPQAMADLVEKCLSPDPGARPAAREIVERLNSL